MTATTKAFSKGRDSPCERESPLYIRGRFMKNSRSISRQRQRRDARCRRLVDDSVEWPVDRRWPSRGPINIPQFIGKPAPFVRSFVRSESKAFRVLSARAAPRTGYLKGDRIHERVPGSRDRRRAYPARDVSTEIPINEFLRHRSRRKPAVIARRGYGPSRF